MWFRQVIYTGLSPAPVAQGIERAPPEREVAGSIPAGRIASLLGHLGTVKDSTGQIREAFGQAPSAPVPLVAAVPSSPGTWRMVGGMKSTGKTRGSSTARRPPVPTDSHVEIEDWIRSVMPGLHPIVERLDELIRETIPGLQYAIKWKKAYYGLPELGWMIEMVAYDVSVNVVFFGGADFDPPPPLGTSKRTRYVKVQTLEEAQAPMMGKWIEQAGRVRGWQ
jgi:hypothetical protein